MVLHHHILLTLAIAAIAEAILMQASAEQVPSLHRVAPRYLKLITRQYNTVQLYCQVTNAQGMYYSTKHTHTLTLTSHVRTQRTQSLNVIPLKPGVGQYIAIHATLTARDFFLAYFYPSVHLPAFFSPKTSPDFSCVGCD